MTGYETQTSHHGHAAMCRAEAEQDAFERRVEEIKSAAFDGDDFYDAPNHMSESERDELAAWVDAAGEAVPYQLRNAMEKARELRAEHQAEAELKTAKHERGAR